jgi:hypothetical protein
MTSISGTGREGQPVNRKAYSLRYTGQSLRGVAQQIRVHASAVRRSADTHESPCPG